MRSFGTWLPNFVKNLPISSLFMIHDWRNNCQPLFNKSYFKSLLDIRKNFRMAAKFCFRNFNVVGFDLDMTICRYRTQPFMDMMYRLVLVLYYKFLKKNIKRTFLLNVSVRALATFLVDQRSYPKSLMDPFKPQEIKIMSKANVIDWKNFTVSRVDKDGIMRMLLSTPERYLKC